MQNILLGCVGRMLGWRVQCRRKAARHASDLGLVSYYAATLAYVKASEGCGMFIAEFPTTLEAVRASHELGLKVLMGAPNSVLGGARSGNIAAELAQHDMLGILSRDYYSTSLLQAAWLLVGQDNGYDLPGRNSCWPRPICYMRGCMRARR